MKRKFYVSLALICLSGSPPLFAPSGTWNSATGGNWSDTTKWVAGTVADGAGNTAAFSLVNAPIGVVVDTPRTIGHITLGAGSSATYTFSSQSLTLSGGATIRIDDVSSGTQGVFNCNVIGDNGFTVNCGTQMSFNGVISGTGTGFLTYQLNAGGSITVGGASPNTYTFAGAPGTSIAGLGTFNYNKDGAFPPSSDSTHEVALSGQTQLQMNASMTSANAFRMDLASSIGLTCTMAVGNNANVFLNGLLDTAAGTHLVTLDSVGTSNFQIIAGTNTFAGVVSGGVQSVSPDPTTGNCLTVSGSAVQTLSGTNTYITRTFIGSGGTLIATNSNSLGASNPTGSPVFVRGGGNLQTNAAITLNKDIFLNGTGIASAGALIATGTVSGNVTMGWTGTSEPAADVSVSNGGTLTFTGSVSGANNIEKIGAGTLQLFPASGSNTFTGNFTVTAGVLEGNTSGFSPSSSATITNNATVQFTQNTPGTYPGAISGSGNLIKQGTSTLTLSGANTYAGGTSINAGIISLTGSLNPAGTVNLTAMGTQFNIDAATGSKTIGDFMGVSTSTCNLGSNNLTVGTSTSSVTFSGAISGAGGLTKQGTGTFILAGTNTYAGGTTINAGTVSLTGSLNSAGAVSLAGAGTAFNINGSLMNQTIGDFSGVSTSTCNLGSNSLTVGTSTPSVTFSGAISGTGGLIKQGTGTLIVTGANSYGGGTTITTGVLQGTTTGLQGNITNNATLAFNQSTTGTYAGAITGAGGLTIDSSGSGVVIFSGVSSGFTGTTTINSLSANNPTLQMGIANALPNSTSMTINSGGTFNLQDFSQTVKDIAGSGSIVIGNAMAATTLTVNPTSSSITFPGAISGVGGLTKTGANTLVLTGTNT
ncbi:MAG TPA: autotransporter-associated beta strand repeat-containing protein, partial [Rhabdochlamydiaceae bacterium]|nr:autotransporter-associated beta strand repeat-containing protein [Rhabdochlamydiaceae bacterium]